MGSLFTAVTTVSNLDASSLSVNLKRSICVSRRQTTNLTEASPVEDRKPSDDTAHISDAISVSLPNHNTRACELFKVLSFFILFNYHTQRRRKYCDFSSLIILIQLPILTFIFSCGWEFISHNLDFFHTKMHLWVLKMYGCEFGYSRLCYKVKNKNKNKCQTI